MSDQLLLWVVLAVVYGWECACWLRRDSVAFITWLGTRWRLRQPSVLLGNQRGGLVAAPPLPPLGTVVVAAACPVSLSPDGVLGFVSASLSPGGRGAQSAAYFRVEELAQARAHHRAVLVGRQRLAQTGSVAAAHWLVANLKALASCTPAQRGQEIQKQIRRMFDGADLQASWKKFREQSVWLRRWTNVLFVFLFMVAPVAVWFLGFGRAWLPLLVVLLALTTTTSILFHRLHREFFPELEDERFTHFILVLLSPATSIRAADTISRPLLQRYHPLVVGRQFLAMPAFRQFARRVLIELRHPALPLCPRSEPEAQAAERFWREAQLEHSEKFLRQQGLDPEELLAPPETVEAGCVAYCPRCRTQFTTLSSTCADCGGMALVAMPSQRGSRR